MNRHVLEQAGQEPPDELTPDRGKPDAVGDMVTTNGAQTSSVLDRKLLRTLLGALGQPAISVRLWDGWQVAPEGRPALAELDILDRGTLWRLALNPLFQFGEGYARGTLRVTGDLEAMLVDIFRSFNRRRSAGTRLDQLFLRLQRPHGHSARRSRENIHHHYDIGNDFYRLWLDENLVYTCAYFANRSWTLEQAQLAKMEHVCRKVGLRPGMHVHEAGCGWGSLALHMAREHGVTVRACNISREQIDYARQAANRQALADRVEFVLDDWRNLSGPCDAFVSVGMLEHVGVENYPLLGQVIDRCLSANGRGLIHSIGQNYPRPMNPWTERRIFPGAYPPSLREMMNIFEPWNLSVLDVENLRLHYAETLRRWLERYERSAEQVRAMFDEQFVRTWRLYLTASMAGFEAGGLQLFQVVFARGMNNEIDWTREALYAPGLVK
jgi:cyclopropane-fatty-acyl-phospholipid synthase